MRRRPARRVYHVELRDEKWNPVILERVVAPNGKEAISRFAQNTLNIKGDNLKRFLQDNKKERMVSAIHYTSNTVHAISRIRSKVAENAATSRLPSFITQYQ